MTEEMLEKIAMLSEELDKIRKSSIGGTDPDRSNEFLESFYGVTSTIERIGNPNKIFNFIAHWQRLAGFVRCFRAQKQLKTLIDILWNLEYNQRETVEGSLIPFIEYINENKDRAAMQIFAEIYIKKEHVASDKLKFIEKEFVKRSNAENDGKLMYGSLLWSFVYEECDISYMQNYYDKVEVSNDGYLYGLLANISKSPIYAAKYWAMCFSYREARKFMKIWVEKSSEYTSFEWDYHGFSRVIASMDFEKIYGGEKNIPMVVKAFSQMAIQ